MGHQRVAIGLVLALGVLGCDVRVGDDGKVHLGFESGARKPSPETEKTTPQIEVTVTEVGDILVEGSTLTLNQLASRLDEEKFKAEPQEVWYYRENPAGEPHPVALEVIELIADRGLGVSLSTEPDFSTWVDEAGNARRRR